MTLDNSHSSFCSCTRCIDWRHATRISERQEAYHRSYDVPLPIAKRVLFWGVAGGAVIACLWAVLPYAVRWIFGPMLELLRNIFAGSW